MITEKGTLSFIGEIEKGTSKAGNEWKKTNIVVDREGINEAYCKVAVSVFGDKVDSLKGIKIGERVEIVYTISAREYNGKWYNDVQLFKITPIVPLAPSKPAPAPAPEENDDPKEDLPF